MPTYQRSALACALFAATVAGQTPAQTTDAAAGRRTVEFANSNPTGIPPRGGSWSPDGKRLTFMATDSSLSGEAGDIVQVDAATGKASVLASRAQLDALSSDTISEKDKDHRERYAMSSFLWADDSRHLLLDKGGKLWLYSIAEGTGTLIVDTGAGSGSDAKFSPDAKLVSYLRGYNLYVHPVAGGKETKLTTNGSDAMLNGEVDWIYLEELDVRSNYFWSPDSSAIAYLQMNEEKVPHFPINDWIPTHTGVDDQRYPQPGDPNPSVRVGIVPAKGGETKFVEVPFSAGNDSIPRFGWVDDRTIYIEVLTRDNTHENLYFADTRTGKSRLAYTNTDAKYLDENYDVTFLPHSRFVTASWRDGHTHLYLYQHDEKHPLDAEAKLLRQLTTGDFEVEGISGYDDKSDTLFFTSNEGTPLENGLWAMHLDGSGKRLVTAAGGGVHEVLLSPDARHFSDLSSTMIAPPVASVCPVASSGTCGVFWKSKPIAKADGVVSSAYNATAADGKTRLLGRLTMPAGTAAGSIPLILNPYGGPLPTPGVRNSWGNGNLFNELLAQHGFAVLDVDNRGMGGRGRDFQQAGYRNFGSVQFSDQMAALDQVLKDFPQLDAKRIGWWGWSWGGHFTLYAMTHTDRIKAGVAVAPVTDFRNYDSIYTERYLGLPAANNNVYDAASDALAAKNLKGRVLIAHGTGDDNVHISNTIQFIQPLIEAGIPYDLQLFPRKTHSIAGAESRNELYGRILFHFETYLK